MTQAFDPDAAGPAIFVLREGQPALDGPWRTYRRARLLHVSDGVLSVRTESMRWVLPRNHALWLVARTPHCLHAAHTVGLQMLYASPDTAPLIAHNVALTTDRLVRALLDAAADLPQPASRDPCFDEPARRLLQVLLDRLPLLPPAPLGLAWPADARLRKIAVALADNLARPAVLEELALAAGVTARTAARLFIRETGQTFGQWRQQLRLLAALEHLGGGASVSQAALEVGYSDVSSFIAVFRDAFGDTPARYFR